MDDLYTHLKANIIKDNKSIAMEEMNREIEVIKKSIITQRWVFSGIALVLILIQFF